MIGQSSQSAQSSTARAIPHEEARVLAAMICDEHRGDTDALAATNALETLDFASFLHRWIFDAVRNVGASGEDVTVDELIRQLSLDDARTDGCTVELCVPEIARIVAFTAPYPGSDLLVADVSWIRRLAARRRHDAVIAEIRRPLRRRGTFGKGRS